MYTVDKLMVYGNPDFIFSTDVLEEEYIDTMMKQEHSYPKKGGWGLASIIVK